MQNKHPIITYAYHFLSEAIMLFLISLPILYYHYEWIPYGSYILLVVVICLLFSIFAKWSNTFTPYIVAAPIMMFVFYLCSYPIVLSIAFPAILVWRYINIRRETILSREVGYIQVTLILATGLLLLTNEFQVILYAFLQFIVLIFGYLSSHLTVIEKEERKRFGKKLWISVIGPFAVGTVIIFLLFDSSRYIFLKITEAAIYVATVALSKIAALLPVLDFDTPEINSIFSKLAEQDQTVEGLQQTGPSLAEKIQPYIYLAIAILIACFVVFLAARTFRNRFKVRSQIGKSEAVLYGSLDKEKQEKRTWKDKVFGSYFHKPSHPVRKMVYQFERNAAKNGYGRNAFETVEEWLGRLGVNADLSVYQKVRYGESDVSEQEIYALKEQLKEMDAKLGD